MIDVKALKVNKMYKDFVTDILKNHYLCKIVREWVLKNQFLHSESPCYGFC